MDPATFATYDCAKLIQFVEKHLAKRLANEYNVPLRQREKVMDPYARCDDTFEKDHVTYEYLKSIINCNDETIEIMCHPGLIMMLI